MNKFSIEIPSNENIGQAREELKDEIKDWYIDHSREFLTQLRPSHMEPKEIRMRNLLMDVEAARYWGTLWTIDGSEHETCEQRDEARCWAKATFSDFEIQNILNLSVKTALLVPFNDGRPASKRGHSELYKAFVEQEDSMFHDAVTPAVKKRLINGMFWENIVGSSGSEAHKILEWVLQTHQDKLDPSFANQGYEIFARTGGEVTSYQLNAFSKKALEKYISFVGSILRYDEVDTLLTPQQFFQLVRPYFMQKASV